MSKSSFRTTLGDISLNGVAHTGVSNAEGNCVSNAWHNRQAGAGERWCVVHILVGFRDERALTLPLEVKGEFVCLEGGVFGDALTEGDPGLRGSSGDCIESTCWRSDTLFFLPAGDVYICLPLPESAILAGPLAGEAAFLGDGEVVVAALPGCAFSLSPTMALAAFLISDRGLVFLEPRMGVGSSFLCPPRFPFCICFGVSLGMSSPACHCRVRLGIQWQAQAREGRGAYILRMEGALQALDRTSLLVRPLGVP